MGKYFTIAELCRSEKADQHGINNKCNKQQAEQLKQLIENVLDPLRELYGKPIKVNSGFRCAELNKLVGGKPTSQHLRGEAADITAGSREENKKLFQLIKEKFPFDQLIDEKNYAWVHVSFNEKFQRNQILSL